MVAALVDTSVLVDILRLNHTARHCLIASANQRLQIPLYTTNLKHFTPLLGGLAQQPY